MQRESDGRDFDARSKRTWRGASFVLVSGLALGAFAISLLATLPASVAARYVSPPIEFNGYSGTVWNGAATFAGGHVVRWRVDAVRSAAARAPQVELDVTGPGTELAGHLAIRDTTGRDLRIDALSGRLGWPLVAALAPGLDVACDAAATLANVAIETAAPHRAASGRIAAGPGACSETSGGGAPVPLPELSGVLESGDAGVAMVVTAADAPDVPLGRIEVSDDDRLIVTMEPAAAGLVPGLPTSGATTLEYPLPW